MKLIEITIEGFGSIIQPITYVFDRPGLNIISGPNGSGKTTILNALSWCLYKQLLKKKSSYEPWESIKPEKFKGTYVRVILKDDDNCEWIIHRTDKKLELFKYEERFPGKNKDAIQKEIERLIGYSFELFKNAILFGQGLDRLTAESGPDKKRIFDEAFNIEYISKARDLADKRLKSSLDEKESLLTRKHNFTALYKNNQDMYLESTRIKEEFQAEQEKAIKEAKERIKTYRTKIKDLKPQIETLTHQLGDYFKAAHDSTYKIPENLKEQEFKAMLEHSRAEELLEKLINRKAELKTQLFSNDGICNLCGQKLPKKDSLERKNHLKKEYKLLLEQIRKQEENNEVLLTKHKELTDELERINQIRLKTIPIIEKHTKATAQRSLLKSDLKLTINLLKNSKEELGRIETRKPPKTKPEVFKANMDKFKGKIEVMDAKLIEIQKEIDINTWLIKDPLSNSGLKAFIFNSMLSKVNRFLGNYTRNIGMSVNVYVNMESANKDILISVIKNNQEVPYPDLSMGQKQLVDVTLAFAINDTINYSRPFNVLLMDEIFESLDKENVEIIGDIIKQKSLTRSIHLITHQASFSPSNTHITNLYLREGKYTAVRL